MRRIVPSVTPPGRPADGRRAREKRASAGLPRRFATAWRRLVPRLGPVGLAVSGGADSMALLHLAHGLEKKRRANRLVVIHVNHGLRGAESNRDERFVRATARSLDLPVIVRRIASPPPRSEDAARRRRYGAFAAIGRRKGLAAIALAHHQDDRIETLVMRLLRDAGPRGQAGIPVRRPLAPDATTEVVRPLADFRRAELRAFLAERGIPFVEDSSNRSDIFLRNRIRRVLASPASPDAAAALDAASLRFMDAARRLSRRIDRAAAALLARAVRRQARRFVLLDAAEFRGAPAAVVHAALGTLAAGIDPAAPPLDPRSTRAAMEILAGRRSHANLPRGIRLSVEHGALLLTGPPAPQPHPRRLDVPGRIAIPESGIVVSAAGRGGSRGCYAAEVVDRDALRPPLQVRLPRPGDRFRPLGAAKETSLRRFLKGQRVPSALRPFTPVLADRKGIVWVVGLRIADRVKLRPETRRRLRLGAGRCAPATTRTR